MPRLRPGRKPDGIRQGGVAAHPGRGKVRSSRRYRARRRFAVLGLVAGMVIAATLVVEFRAPNIAAHRSRSAQKPKRVTRQPKPVRPASSQVLPQIQGVGELSVQVSEPGRLMCPPSTGTCLPRSFLLHVYYPSTFSTGGTPLVGAPVATARDPYPAIVFATGFNMDPSGYLQLIDGWVQAGYVVAAPRFPLDSAWALNHYGVNLSNVRLADAFESDMLNEPGDMEAAANELSALNSQPSSALHGKVNTAEVAAAGQSDGGDAALALVDNTCCRDTAIKAAMILSGAEFSPYGGAYFGTSIPLLIVQGTADPINPSGLSAAIYQGAQPPKYLIWLQGADHLVGYTSFNPYEQVVMNASLAFLATYLRGEPLSVSKLAVVGDVNQVASEQYDAG